MSESRRQSSAKYGGAIPVQPVTDEPARDLEDDSLTDWKPVQLPQQWCHTGGRLSPGALQHSVQTAGGKVARR